MNAQPISSTLKHSKFSRSFPSVEQEGCYNQIMLMVSLPDIEKSQKDEIEDNGITIDNYLLASTIRHEQAHFIDHIATLHGQKNLVLLFNAIHAYLAGDVEDYWRIHALIQNNKRDIFGDYFTETYLDHDSSFQEPWDHRISSGVRFDLDGKINHTLPLLFIRFNKPDGTPLARTPLSVASIHETSAIYEELKLKNTFIDSIQSNELKLAEHEEMIRDSELILYSTDFALYSAAAHIVAKSNGLTDISGIYSLSSSLGILALNLKVEHASVMKIKMINDQGWNDRFRAMADNADIGYTFYRLNENLVTHVGPNEYSLENVLEASGLPVQSELELEIMEAMMFNLYELKNGPFYIMAQTLLNFGMEIYSKRGLDGKKEGYYEWLAENYPFPHIYFKDTIINPDEINLQSALDNLVSNHGLGNIQDHYKVFTYILDKFIEFNEVCGV